MTTAGRGVTRGRVVVRALVVAMVVALVVVFTVVGVDNFRAVGSEIITKSDSQFLDQELI